MNIKTGLRNFFSSVLKLFLKSNFHTIRSEVTDELFQSSFEWSNVWILHNSKY